MRFYTTSPVSYTTMPARPPAPFLHFLQVSISSTRLPNAGPSPFAYYPFDHVRRPLTLQRLAIAYRVSSVKRPRGAVSIVRVRSPRLARPRVHCTSHHPLPIP